MSFLSKKDRITCWNSRDLYWNCLDQSKSKDLCEKYRKAYENVCPAQWVKHFDRKRDYLAFKNRFKKEGFIPAFPEKEKL